MQLLSLFVQRQIPSEVIGNAKVMKTHVCGRNKENVPAIGDENGCASFMQGGERDRTTQPGTHEFTLMMRKYCPGDMK